jgi:hypothetical protein
MVIRGSTRLTVVLAAALLTGGGCTSGTPELDELKRQPAAKVPTTAPSPTVDVDREAFVQALRRTQGASVKFNVRGSLPESQKVQGSGAFDPKAKLWQATIKVTGGKYPSAGQRIVIGKYTYVREPGDKVWVRLDLSRVKKDNRLVYFDMTDPTGLVKFGKAVASARQTGPGAYEGRFDPDNVYEPFVPIGAPSVLSIGLRTAQFTATVDARGWVTAINVKLEPGDGPALTMTTTLSGHGTKLPITAPPKAQVREAADFYYD